MPFIADLPTPAAAVPPAIVVTAERSPQAQSQTPASVTLIDAPLVEHLGEPLLAPLLRLVPSAALATSGPAGSQTQLRIRGAEANHTLLFVDGIRANDPAAGNEPRFELLSADLASRVEVLRGPQSALWGSEAIGGVVAVSGLPTQGATAQAETGSFGFARLSGSVSGQGERIEGGIAGGFQRARGIDSFSGEGERDGYRNAKLRGRIFFKPSTALTFEASGFAIASRAEFDGFDPNSFLRADTLDESRSRLGAGRLGARWIYNAWTVSGAVSHLASGNRNYLGDEALNRTRGTRSSAQLQVERELDTGSVEHRLIAAADADRETFAARDQIFFGATDQDQDRSHVALTGEWRATWGALVTDVALRHDRFNRFKDATSLRAGALLTIGRGWSAAASYGEGIAQPTFFDLYGFFPNSFVGNPDLRPERSRGAEAGLRYARGPLSGSVTVYSQRLRNEIVDVFLPEFRSTVANAEGTSRRAGIELEGRWSFSDAVRIGGSYAYLKASERRDPADRQVREVRRPRHSGSLFLDGESGRFSYGASLALVGARRDFDFDLFQPVRLSSYALASARLAYRVTEAVELFGRVANGFDDRYQDVFGYRTEGRSVYAGIQLGRGG